MAALVNFTNLDFDQIRTSLRDYLRANSNFTDYDFEGSTLSILLDVLAYNTYIASYNANMVSNEVFIDSATLRENVVSLAKNIGYTPRSRTASTTNITFTVDTTGFSTLPPTTLSLKSGTVCTTSSSFGNTSYTFSIPDDVTVPVVNGIATFDNIKIYEGSYQKTYFTVDTSKTTQKFILENANIDTALLRVSVRDNASSSAIRKFNLSTDLLEVNSDSKVFFLQEIEDQRYELIFGDGIFGQKLDNLNYIEVSYVITNGKNGNGLSSFNFSGRLVDNNGNIVSSGISLITASAASDGGTEIESIASIKKYAPRIYASQNRAVTSTDYETIVTKIYPETESITVFGGEELTPPQYGKVFIALKPFYGPFVPNSIKDNLKSSLRKYSVAGIVPEIIDLKYLYVEVDTSVYYNTNLAPSANFVSNIVQNNIGFYANSTELNKYGARFKYSKYQKIVDDSHESITSNITKVIIRRDLSAKLNQLAEYEICYGNSFHIKNNSGYNIKSSGFAVDGISGTLYLSDTPNSDMNTGTVFMFKLNSDTQPVIVRKSVGTIDYIKGEISLNPIKFLSTQKSILGQPIIEISAIPRSNDVIGLQDLYLQLDINNSVVNMVSDEISSGSDTSGSTYISTSSYSNGNLVRS
jgi:hypothetical protein